MNAPAGYTKLPDGVRCECIQLWRESHNGPFWCCNEKPVPAPMTGDGAVVRTMTAAQQMLDGHRNVCGGWNSPCLQCLVARAYLAQAAEIERHKTNERLQMERAIKAEATVTEQAAEIERLTGDLKSALSREKTMTETAMVIAARAEASEARTADLLKALRRLAIRQHVRMTEIGGTVPNGSSCEICGNEWGADGVELHQPDCLAAKGWTV